MQYKNLKNIKAENQRNRQSDRLKNDITRRLLNYLERKYEMRYNTALDVRKSERLGVMNLLCLLMNGCVTQSLSRHGLMGLMRGTKISDDIRSRGLSRLLILWTTSSIVCVGDGTERRKSEKVNLLLCLSKICPYVILANKPQKS